MDRPVTHSKRFTLAKRAAPEEMTGCPLCGNHGIAVSSVTVEHLVIDRDQIKSPIDDFCICMNPDCDVVYYCGIPEIRFVKNQIRVPLWYKKDADPKYACYCSRVTEAQVIDAVRNHGAQTVADVNCITGAMKNSDCIHNNPLGVCCHRIILACIEKENQKGK